MGELEQKANPNHKLALLVSESNEVIINNQHISHRLLSRLCDQKDEQKDREVILLDAIEKLTHRIEKRDKTGLKFSLLMVMIASLAFGLDLVQVGDNVNWQSIKLFLSGFSCL